VRLDCHHHYCSHGPVDRLIDAHQRSLALARCAQSEQASPASCEADATQCRVVINALRREIDRLQAGIVQRYDLATDRADLNSFRCESPTTVAATPSTDFSRQSIFGVPALSDVGGCSPSDSVSMPSNEIQSWLRVTNLGTLLDVLA